MEIALVSIPLRIAAGKVANVIGDQIGLFADATKDLEEIRDKFQSIEAVLVDAERKQITDESVRLWLSKLKGIALDIEDVVDKWQISSGGDENKVRSTCLPLILAYFKPSLVFLRRKIAIQVKEIRRRLDAIHGDRLMSSFSSSSIGGETEIMRFSSDWRHTSWLVEESEIIGRVKDKETVISWLVSDLEEEVHVTAIVGVGGLGKTTLARQIFNDPKVKDRFKEALYWVCVSDVFDVRKLTKDILEAINGSEGAATSSTQLSVLQKNLLESLKGKRFLLILDDVWNEDDEKWETLRLSLKSDVQGSRILVTTRSEKVAEIMKASSRIHKLEGLSDDLSWELFCRRAFPEKKPEEFAEFESIGREIVNKCLGVPLSIKVMGSTMKEKTTMADWQNILESEMWSLPEVKGGILPSLQLSYYNLPPHLKQCFAYCSIYQKDKKLKKNELVNLWIAQGFIRPEGNREIEDIGEEYFNGLVARSMFQEVFEDYRGHITCKMHDLLNDLAAVITQDETHIFTVNKMSNPQCSSIGGLRHASLLLPEDNASISIASCPAKKLRTLFSSEWDKIRGVHDKLFRQAKFLRALVFRDGARVKVPSKALGKLKHLRYLDLSSSSIAELPPKTIERLKYLRYLNLSRSSIVELPPKTIERLYLLRYLDLSFSQIKKLPDAFGKMKQLRYLDLSVTVIEELPESMSHLVNLHTLNLTGCSRLKILCGGISKIIGLRHLYIMYTGELRFLPKGIGKLTSLQSLSKFIVGGDKGEYCGIDELQELNALQGRLEIKGLGRVSEAEQARRAQLCKKQYLRTLVLDISSGKRGAEDDKEEERIKLLECLRPHPNLQDLFLEGRSISKLTLPSWMGDPSFSNLSSISIDGFQNQWNPDSTMPGLGTLPGLKRLEFCGVGVRKLGDEFYYGIGMMSSGNDGVGKRRGVAFPKLEILHLRDMRELEEWELTGEAEASRVMPSLRELKVKFCPKLQLLPSHLTSTPPSSSSSSPSSSEVLEESENYCDELKPLPFDPHYGLIPLKSLKLISCEKLQSLPHSLGQLKKLQSLVIGDVTELTCLPDSLGQLESLEKLVINDCYKLESLPHSLGGLKKLQSLEISGVTLKSLPHSLGGLKKLKSLGIRSVKRLESLPDWLGKLESLEHLRIDDCHELDSVCHSLGGLKSLKINNAEKLESLPNALGQLASLEFLQIYRCKKLKSLPDSLGRLHKLKRLRIQYCEELESLPDSLQQLSLLQELRVDGCPQLPYGPEGRREDWPQISHIQRIIINDRYWE